MQRLMLLDDLITMLAGIWKYSSLDYFLANKRQVSKDVYKANEYAIRLVRLWDQLDRLSEDVIVKAIVELEGSIIGKKEHLKRAATHEWKRKAKAELTLFKILRTQLEDYLAATREQAASQELGG
jgi:hypothetical protein